jgi:polycystin 1L2
MRQTISKCQGDYSLSNEDHQSWFPGWKSSSDNISYSQSIENAFIYQSGSYKSEGIENTYDTGGYVYEFRGRLDDMQSNLTKLHQLSWIDSHTRAIIIQMTLFNPNVELFTSVTFLIELFSTSGVFVQSRFDPIDLHNQFQGILSLIHIIGCTIYMLFIIYFTVIEIHSFIKLKQNYFNSIWLLIQWGTIICSWIGLEIYIWRLREGSHLNELFLQTNGYKYINIETGVYYDNILTYLFGFCCFFSTIKYLYLFRFNSRLCQFGKTLEYVQKDLFYFGWMFIIILISFTCLFYLLFSSKISSCSDILQTIEMLFQTLLFNFNSEDLYEADAFLGPFTFTLFVYFAVFICCTMFISIINNGFRHTRLESKSRTNQNQDVLLFIFKKIKSALGLYNQMCENEI